MGKIVRELAVPNIFTTEVIKQFLAEAPELTPYVKQVDLVLEPTRDPPFERLVRSIIYQQLSGKAAGTIHGRFLDLVGELHPERLLELEEEELRSVGLSRQKAGYVKNVARAFVQGGHLASYTQADDLDQLSAQEIIDLFTSIKGVGEWTVQMYLIFGLGRMDIFASKDLGVRNGLQLMYELEETPTPGAAKKITSHWESYPTFGTVLCWRIQD